MALVVSKDQAACRDRTTAEVFSKGQADASIDWESLLSIERNRQRRREPRTSSSQIFLAYGSGEMLLGFLHRRQSESWDFAGGKAQIVNIEVCQAESAQVVKLVGIELDAIISVTVAVQGEQQSDKVGDIVSWCSFSDPHDAVGSQNIGRVGVGAQRNFAQLEFNGLIREVIEEPVLIGGGSSAPGSVAEALDG